VALIVVLEAREQPYGDGGKEATPTGKRSAALAWYAPPPPLPCAQGLACEEGVPSSLHPGYARMSIPQVCLEAAFFGGCAAGVA